MTRIAVLVSGGGTNLQALIDSERAGKIPHGSIELVIASNEKAYALERAKNAGIETRVVRRKDYADQDSFDAALSMHCMNMISIWSGTGSSTSIRR